jgi:ribonuclease III
VAAFTHPGLASSKTELSYDRLEWIGDAYLYLISSSLIFQTFGGLATGRCAQLREICIRNATLGEYSQHYGLPSRARLPKDFLRSGNSSGPKPKESELKKIWGDLFEAYVAAVILSDPTDGLARAANWLKALWAMTLKAQILDAEKKPEMKVVLELGQKRDTPADNIPPKVRLAQVIGAKGVTLRYVDLKTSKDRDHNIPLFTIGVYIDGWGVQNELLGTGSARSKKEAGQKAAQEALNKKKRINYFENEKRKFLAAMDE